ncbi:MAG TPA: xyloglucanase, partial [Armatimonadaceae bacterium]|nr:xyloglucanase [Armatimonadaceae bacterium]
MTSPVRRSALLLAFGLAAGCVAPAALPPPFPTTSARADGKRAAFASEPYRWRNAAIVGGGFVTGILFHPKEKDLVYARTDVGGAYRWDAKGKRWTPLTDEFGLDSWNFTGIESFAVDPNDPERVYLAVGTYTNDWAGNGAILRSADRGRTWRKTDLPFKNGGNQDGRSNGERLAVDPNRGDVLFFGTRNQGLWNSSDRGGTWKPVPGFPEVATSDASTSGSGQWKWPVGIVFVEFLPGSGKRGQPTPTLYAGVSTKETSLYRSDDGGATWKAVFGQPTGLRPSHAAFSAGAMYVSYGDGPGPNGVTDGAVWKLDLKSGAWTDVTPVKPAEGDRFGYGGVTADARRPGTLMASTIDRWTRGDTLFRSTDGGKTWSDLGPKSVRDSRAAPYLRWGKPAADLGHWIGDIDIDPHDSDRVLYVTGATIWASRDVTAADRGGATHWYVGAEGLEETVVEEVVSPPSGAPLLSGMRDIDGFRHEDLTVSPRTGSFWPNHNHTTSIDFAERDPSLVARVHGGNNTHGSYSRDNGRTWTLFGGEPTGSRGDGVIAVSADGAAFVWTPNGAAPHVSRDRGATWAACAGLDPRTRVVVSDRVNPRRFYAYDRQEGAVFASADAGATFAPAARGLPGG